MGKGKGRDRPRAELDSSATQFHHQGVVHRRRPAIIALALASSCALPRTATRSLAPFTLTPTHADLGRCFVGESRGSDLTLANATAQPIALEAIEVSCGCQGLELDGETLNKDAHGVMRATLLPGRHQLAMTVAPPRAGEHRVWLRVTGAGHLAAAEFTIRAFDELAVSPACVVLDGVEVDAARAFTADIVAADGQPFALRIDRVTSPLTDVVVDAVGPGQKRVRGSLLARARGPGTADVRMRTDRKFSDWVYVVVRWDIPETCTVEPVTLAFGVVRGGGQPSTRELLIATPASTPPPSCEIDVTPAGAVAQVGDPRVEVLGERRLTRVWFAPAANDPQSRPPADGSQQTQRPLRGRILVRAGGEMVSVPVSGLIVGQD
jgi:hypothetical protein